MKAHVITGVFLSLLLAFSFQPAAAAKKYKVISVSDGGSISGRVSLKGKQPPPEKILITKNKDVCGSGYRALQWVPVGKNNGLQETVVYLKKIAAGKDWGGPAAWGNNTISQNDCVFSPWMQIVRRGAQFTIKNADPVLHNIHIRELIGVKVGRPRGVKRTMLNEAQPGERGALAEDLTTIIKPRRGNYIAINCEAHNFMFAWMFAANHPYAVKTSSDGKYRIDNIPAGKYKLVAWHPTLGPQENKITVKSKKSINSDFVFKSKK